MDLILLISRTLLFQQEKGLESIERATTVLDTKDTRIDPIKLMENSCGKYLSDIVSLNKLYYLKFLKGCLMQILLGPLLNVLSHFMCLAFLES